MREQFYLSLPMKPLCSDACQGLCPDCGTNLNRVTCDCKRDLDDPRLAALKALRPKLNVEVANWTEGPDDAESKTTTLEDADGQAPDA